MKRFVKYSLLTLFFALSTAVAAQSPVVLLKGISNRMIDQLERNKARLSHSGVVNGIVQRTLLPYVDLNRMSALVVGPNYWRSATAGQKSQFKREFTNMVISTYAAAISSYNGDRVLFYPLRGGYSGGTVQVRSVIVRRNGRRIPVSYSMFSIQGSWRVYDFSVENVSIVNSYRAQFSNVLSRSGMTGLIARLQRHNRKVR
ncbi:MAG: ABC transporter substrate-binding protein [Coxiellaceae bacterium]|nr:ABC transporter substrate-binding protein [Coxiellaceae bacterium]